MVTDDTAPFFIDNTIEEKVDINIPDFNYNNDDLDLMLNSEADGYDFLVDATLKGEEKEFEFKQNEEDPQ